MDKIVEKTYEDSDESKLSLKDEPSNKDDNESMMESELSDENAMNELASTNPMSTT